MRSKLIPYNSTAEWTDLTEAYIESLGSIVNRLNNQMANNSNRLNIVVSDKVKETLDELVTRSDSANMTEVIRRALSLYDNLTKDLANDNTQLVLQKVDENGEVKKEQILRII